MKNSQLNILIANMFLVGSFLNPDFVGSIFMLFVGAIWMVFGVLASKQEFELWRINNRLEKAIRNNYYKMFELVVELLEKPKKKRSK